MAALLGVGRGSAAAPRRPALVNARDHLCASCGSTACLKNTRPKTRASVHRHTRMKSEDES